jgi:hypothetical protein
MQTEHTFDGVFNIWPTLTVFGADIGLKKQSMLGSSAQGEAFRTTTACAH